MRTVLTTLHSKYIHPSLALPSLAAFCGGDCGELLIREFTVHEPKQNILAMLLEERPEVVAFSVYLWNRRETLELLDLLHAAAPGIRLVVGGPEVSFDGPELFDRHPGLTALVRGEGELPLRALLREWRLNAPPEPIPRVLRRIGTGLVEGPDGPVLDDLDRIPSPFAAGLVDTSRGFVYLETSRGCPYRCSFCMSARDETVRSFGRDRIEADLRWLLEREVPKIKLVDRTFNYDPRRALEIFRFILEHNRSSHVHFEIGAHLLDAATLELLAEVPAETFQFEIGVQSTLDATLDTIGRRIDRQRLEANLAALQKIGTVDLHLDLIAGLPGERLAEIFGSVDRVMALSPHHLQIEPVKLLPGSPLRGEAEGRGIVYDPHPPYTVLRTPQLDLADLQLLDAVARLLDLTWNQQRLRLTLGQLAHIEGSFAAGLRKLADWWQAAGLFRHPQSQETVFLAAWEFIDRTYPPAPRERLRLAIGRDYAGRTRVLPDRPPPFFDLDLSSGERQRVRERVDAELPAARAQRVKLQHFAAVFANRVEAGPRQIILFFYRTAPGRGLQVDQVVL